MKVVATHDGRFHTDEIFAIAILNLVYPKLKVIRTRKEKEFAKVDIRVDVGRKYNPKTSDFDHHQNEFKLMRKNKIPYASAGLIWKHFGRKLVNSIKAFNYIDEKLIQPIDAIDCGIDIVLKEIIPDYSIGQVTNSYMPAWYEKNQDKNKGFEKALCFATGLLKREIKIANGIKKSEELIKKAIKKSGNKDYIILEENFPFQEYVIKNTKLKYVVGKTSVGWGVWAVPIKIGSFENRKDLPKNWGGLEGEELAKVTGVKDAFSCHRNLFTVVAKSKQSTIKLAELAIKNKEK